MGARVNRANLSLRERRKARIRKRLSGSDQRPRISVFRSVKYTYAQVISDESGKVLASASSNEEVVQGKAASVEFSGSTSTSSKSARAAKALGLVLAERCKEKNLKLVVFDRSGYAYHGRIKALAEGAREGGLEF